MANYIHFPVSFCYPRYIPGRIYQHMVSYLVANDVNFLSRKSVFYQVELRIWGNVCLTSRPVPEFCELIAEVPRVSASYI
jgi:hypothetical protein